MAKSKYLLSNQKKKRKIILFIVCLLVYALLMGYIILNFVGYCNLYSEQYSVLSFIDSTKLLFTPTGFTLPFDFPETLKLMGNIWYVHFTFFLLLLLLFIRRKKMIFTVWNTAPPIGHQKKTKAFLQTIQVFPAVKVSIFPSVQTLRERMKIKNNGNR